MSLIDFADWLEKELERQGMSKADLARGSGISPSQISKILNAKSAPSAEAMKAIAHGLQIPSEEVFQVAGILPPSPETNPTIERAIYYLSQLLPEDQERVMLYLEVLASRYKREKKRP